MYEAKRDQPAERDQYETPRVIASLESLGLITDAEGIWACECRGSTCHVHEGK